MLCGSPFGGLVWQRELKGLKHMPECYRARGDSFFGAWFLRSMLWQCRLLGLVHHTTLWQKFLLLPSKQGSAFILYNFAKPYHALHI